MKTVTIKTTIVCVSLIVIGLFFANLSYAAMDLETLVGLWLFDDGKGDTAKDTSGNGNDGTLINGPKWVNGKFGKALEFDGSDDYVQVQDADSLDMDDEITVMFWFKTNKKMVDRWADRQVVVGKHYLEYEVGIYDGGNVHTYTSDGAGGYDEGIFESMGEELGDADWVLDEWYHLAWTLNGQHEIAYVNGVNIGEFDKANQGTQPGTHTLEIGVRVGGSLPFDGTIDEVAIFNAVLEEDDVQESFNKGIEWALGISAVSPADKLATTWATIKAK